MQWFPYDDAIKAIVQEDDRARYGEWFLVWPCEGEVRRARWWEAKNDETGRYQNFLTDGGRAVRKPDYYMPLPDPPTPG